MDECNNLHGGAKVHRAYFGELAQLVAEFRLPRQISASLAPDLQDPCQRRMAYFQGHSGAPNPDHRPLTRSPQMTRRHNRSSLLG